MSRRAALLCLLLSACTTAPSGHEPSLAPRAAEKIDPRVPIPSEVIAGLPANAVLSEVVLLIGRARSGDLAFQAAVPNVEQLVAAAGPAQSESWIAAQQALSALIAIQAPVTRAITDIDGIASAQLAAKGGILPGDLRYIQAGSGEASAIGEREAAVIDRLQRQLAR